MDAIRKKMKSLKDETDQLYAIIQKFEDATKEANRVADQVDNHTELFQFNSLITRLIATLGTTERKFTASRLSSTRPWTN